MFLHPLDEYLRFLRATARTGQQVCRDLAGCCTYHAVDARRTSEDEPIARFEQDDVLTGIGWMQLQCNESGLDVFDIHHRQAGRRSRSHPHRARRLTGGYLLLTWNIDEVSMRWLDFSDEQAAKAATTQLVP